MTNALRPITPSILVARLVGLLAALLVVGLAGAAAPAAASDTPSGAKGVMISGRFTDASTVATVRQLGAKWVRLNVELGGRRSSPQAFLDAGIDVILTVTNNDPTNVVTTYGTPAAYPNAGFPAASQARYRSQVESIVRGLRPRAGHHVWIQCENEINDASVAPRSRFWRGTTDQYLTLLADCARATHRADPRARVVLAGFPSESLDAAIDARNPHHAFSADRLTRLLAAPSYDVTDLHFYGCVGTITAKVTWVHARQRAGTQWISTENAGPDPRCPSTPVSWRDPSFESVQSQQVTQRITACRSNGGAVCLWFSLRDVRGESDTFNHLGLIDTWSSPARFRPAATAFRALPVR